MREEFMPFIEFTAPRLFRLPGQGLRGLRADALVPRFCSYRDYFAVTRNFAAIYLDLLPFNSFTVSLSFAVTFRDWQKTRHRDADGT
jgi:hypothetical protein